MTTNASDCDSLSSLISHSHYYRTGRLECDPAPYQGQAEPRVGYVRTYVDDTPEYSLVIPVYNQGSIIARTLSHVLCNTVGLYEVILVLDYCSDDTASAAINFFESFPPPPGLCRVVIVFADTPIFETASDNLGFTLSRANFVVEIQADMVVHEYAYNRALTAPLRMYDDICGVSGRCTHTFDKSLGVGKMGRSIEKKLPRLLSRNVIYMLGTCSRGPLALRKDMLEKLGFLDERNYFLDDSDHDLFARAYDRFGWRCGYVPIEVVAMLSDGSTRKQCGSATASHEDLNARVKEEKKRTCVRGYLRTCSSVPRPPIDVRPLTGNPCVAYAWLIVIRMTPVVRWAKRALAKATRLLNSRWKRPLSDQ